MKIMMELSDWEVQFLNKLINDMESYQKISSHEEAIRECIRIAMFDESEPMAADEGM